MYLLLWHGERLGIGRRLPCCGGMMDVSPRLSLCPTSIKFVKVDIVVLLISCLYS